MKVLKLEEDCAVLVDDDPEYQIVFYKSYFAVMKDGEIVSPRARTPYDAKEWRRQQKQAKFTPTRVFIAMPDDEFQEGMMVNTWLFTSYKSDRVLVELDGPSLDRRRFNISQIYLQTPDNIEAINALQPLIEMREKMKNQIRDVKKRLRNPNRAEIRAIAGLEDYHRKKRTPPADVKDKQPGII